MVRQRFHISVALGKFRQAREWAEEYDRICQERVADHPPIRALVPFTGEVNSLTLEVEYRDLEHYGRVSKARDADPEVMNVFRKPIELLEPGEKPWDEFEEDAPHIA